VFTEVAKVEGAFHLVSGRLREEHLAAVPRSHHPCGAVDVHADVVAVGDDRLAAVDSHPHPDTDLGKGVLRGDRGLNGIGRSLEGGEERVATGIDNDATVLGDCRTHDAVVLCEERGVVVSELVQQPRGALDVGEEKGDFSRRERSRLVRRVQSPPPRRRRAAGLRRTSRDEQRQGDRTASRRGLAAAT